MRTGTTEIGSFGCHRFLSVYLTMYTKDTYAFERLRGLDRSEKPSLRLVLHCKIIRTTWNAFSFVTAPGTTNPTHLQTRRQQKNSLGAHGANDTHTNTTESKVAF